MIYNAETTYEYYPDYFPDYVVYTYVEADE